MVPGEKNNTRIERDFNFTLLSANFRPPPSHVNEQKIEKGRQCKGDKRVKKKRTDLPFIFYFVPFGDFNFLSTVFINPDINTCTELQI